MLDIAFDHWTIVQVVVWLAVKSLYRLVECVPTKLPSLQHNPHWKLEPAGSIAFVAVVWFVVLASAVAAPTLLAWNVLNVVSIFSHEPAQDALLHRVEAFFAFLVYWWTCVSDMQ